MENASKALIIAASVLVSIVIISAFVLMMSNLTSYQQKNYETELTSQVTEFNNQFTTYARDDIRGSDMVSLINKVVDYNNRKTTDGYKELQLMINIDDSIRQKLTYSTDGTNYLVTDPDYDQRTASNLISQPKQIENKYQEKYAKQLASEISNIEAIATNSSLTTEGKKNAFDAEGWLPNSASSYGGVNQIYQDALVYYEYVQFKRTRFDCVGEPQFDSDTGRIIKMEFKCTGVGV